LGVFSLFIHPTSLFNQRRVLLKMWTSLVFLAVLCALESPDLAAAAPSNGQKVISLRSRSVQQGRYLKKPGGSNIPLKVQFNGTELQVRKACGTGSISSLTSS
jgi:hypothetical protein